jgi:hypothetical protein
VAAICERVSSEDDDFASLSQSCYVLDVLAEHSSNAAQLQLLQSLGERVFSRAALLLPTAAVASDEEAIRVAEGIKALHQVAQRRRKREADASLLVERLQMTANEENADVHGMLSGLASAMLYLDGDIDDEQLSTTLGLHLSVGEEVLRAAQFIEGLFSLNRSVLVRNRAIIGSLNTFLSAMDSEQFIAILPILRRSLSGLGPHEMGYLVTTIGTILSLDAPREEVKVAASQLDALDLLDQEMGDIFG